ncbi:MAG: SRPBCC domain-containing protein [Saprospiraceae bacterium]|nr:SRPBCC domain-containing protein [Saprospiraceae bacterium]
MANLRHNLVIKATLQEVYKAITTQEGLRGWWTIEATAKPEVGFVNHFSFSEKYFNKMKIVELNPPRFVLWKCLDGDKEWIGTDVRFELEELEGETYLKFSHLNWAHETDYYGVCNFHWGRFMESLKLLCETGQGGPYTGE